MLPRVLSGIQPTGVPHLGNYFGAISSWVSIANSNRLNDGQTIVNCDKPIYFIASTHALMSGKQFIDETLEEANRSTMASLLACGLNQENSIIYKQGDVLENFHLYTILSRYVSQNRLNHMTQYKEKSAQLSKSRVSLALWLYPILQAADILLFKPSYVPIGDDQQQHIELTRDIAETFNNCHKTNFFNLPKPLFDSKLGNGRIRSLRDPLKKMSKSDPNIRSALFITDSDEIIIDKCKKAVTDGISEVYYDTDKRPGVSNLINLYHLTTNLSIEQICDDFANIETAKFKLILADALIEKFKPIRQAYINYMNDKAFLDETRRKGKSQAQPLAAKTMDGVINLLESTSW